jgi:peptidyl-prolyl cis-trans isomerase C
MRGRRLAAGGFALAALFANASLYADGGADDARRAAIVARVGPLEITVGQVESRLGEMPPFQRAAWGNTPPMIRERFLNEVMVPQTLLSLAANAQGIERQAPASYAIERARSTAAVRAIRARIGSPGAISADDVRVYYEQNRARFESPERYQIWRILYKTREAAQAALRALKSNPTPKAFSEFARNDSQDRGTSLRGGNLGFVTADGTSSEPGLRVDPAVMRAVQAVQDGDLVPAPVEEGPYFAVAWRRGSVASVRQSVDDAAPLIRDTLWKNRVKAETDELLASLRAAKVRDVNESFLESINMTDVTAERAHDGGLRP